MRSFRVFNRRAGAVFAAAGLVLTSTLPTLVAAETVTSRSIAMSSSVKSATSVYDVDFTTKSAGTGAVVIDFCTTAAIGATCTAPAGFAIGTVGTSSAHTITKVGSTGVKVVLSSTVAASTPVAFDITGITNPNTTDVFYARIVTYANDTDATAYAADDIDNAGANVHLDDGSVALAPTDGFGVSGRVAETMVFCAGGSTTSFSTGCTGTITDPNLTLGTNGVLDTTASTGTIKTQISTNASHGAVVYLKSDAAGCGGLVREGGAGDADAGCGIAPITVPNTTATITGAFFGLKLGGLGGASSTTTALVGGGTGTYDTSNYYMGYAGDDNSGVTGPYGDAVFNTSGGPVSDGTADLTFGAAIGALTPAGNYKAAFNLIATGTF